LFSIISASVGCFGVAIVSAALRNPDECDVTKGL
jgi:hypothetical protein